VSFVRGAKRRPNARGSNYWRKDGRQMMKFKLLGTGLAAMTWIATAFAAQAADIPRPVYKGMPIRPVIAYYNWTGFYAGLNAGYGFGTSTWSGVPGGGSVKPSPSGFLVGGTLGYNYQIGSFVYGIEGDWDWTGIKGSATCVGVVTCTTDNPWLATFRGRVGYAFDRWLPYLTGGGAYGNIKATASIPGASVSSTKSELGWTFGGGVEYAFLGNWSAKIEYLYVDLGSAAVGGGINVSLKENIVRGGLNYKFSGPIFSRY
jgi:outer membrane immunogenic protein